MEAAHFKLTIDALERISASVDLDDLRRNLTRDLATLGYENLLFALAPAPHRQTFDRLVLLQHWPAAWFEQYNRLNFHRHDPIANFARKQFTAFEWSAVPASDDPVSQRMMESSAHDFGMQRGICIPVHDQFGYRAAISLATSQQPLVSGATIEMIVVFAFNRLNRIHCAARTSRLTAREKEVVTWAAAGKSAWDTSSILNVSEQTIEKHLSSAMRKLDAYSKAQVVAESLRVGEISL